MRANDMQRLNLNVLLLSLLPLTIDLKSSDQPSLPELADWVDGYLSLDADFETTYEVTWYFNGGVPDENADWHMRDRVRIVVSGDQLRQELHRTERGEGAAYTLTKIWDGQRTWTIYPDEDQVSVSSAPPHAISGPFDHPFNRIRSRFFPHHWQQTIEGSSDGSVEFGDKAAQAQCVYGRDDDFGGTLWTFAVGLHADQPTRLKGISHSTPLRGNPTQDHVQVVRWEVESWSDYYGHELPSVARTHQRIRRQPSDPESEWVGSVVVYRRLDFHVHSDQPVDPLLFKPPLDEGTELADDDLGMVIEIGEPYVNFDGTTYKLPEPLWSHPGDRLPQLIASAVPIHPTSSGQPGTFVSGPDSTTQQRLITPIMAGLITMLALLAGIVAFRHYRTRGS